MVYGMTIGACNVLIDAPSLAAALQIYTRDTRLAEKLVHRGCVHEVAALIITLRSTLDWLENAHEGQDSTAIIDDLRIPIKTILSVLDPKSDGYAQYPPL